MITYNFFTECGNDMMDMLWFIFFAIFSVPLDLILLPLEIVAYLLYLIH